VIPIFPPGVPRSYLGFGIAQGKLPARFLSCAAYRTSVGPIYLPLLLYSFALVDMSGAPNTVCHCPTCDAGGGLQANGQPQGRSFTPRHYKAHLLRITRENSERSAGGQPQIGIEEAASTMFVSALLDDGPDLETLPSKLWTSRAAFQKGRAPHISPTAQPYPSSTSSIDVITDSIRHLTVSSNDPLSSVNDITDKLDTVTFSNDSSTTNDPTPSPKPVISVHRHSGMSKKDRSKKDRSQRTVKDLAVLTLIQDELRICSKTLSTTSPSSSTIKDTRATLAQARRSMQKIRRCTTETTQLKHQIAEQINNIDSRLTELDSLTSQVGPIEYSTGKSLITTRSRTILKISSRASLYDVHSSLRYHCTGCNFPWRCVQRHHEY